MAETLDNPSYFDDPNVKVASTTFESMSGANTIVVLEFPTFEGSGYEGSVYVKMNSVTTLSWSVYRAKIPVTPIGENTVTGFALGNKTVAGHIIKTLTYADEFTSVVEYYSKLAIKYKQDNYYENLGSKQPISFDNNYKITQKNFDSLMKDDLLPFNIHAYSISEYTGKIVKDSIYGCTVINTGQVQSIENLITENTISFMAKYLEQNKDVTQNLPSYPSLNGAMSMGKLLALRKK
jgi:hypothetical protein